MLTKIKASTIFVMMTTLLCSCGASVDEYKNLSKAGQMYSTALENLLVKSGEITIEKTSEDLLVEDISNNPITKERYNQRSKENKLTLKSLQRLIVQTRLFKSYFKQLEVLANSDSAETANFSAKNIGDNIFKLSGELKSQETVLKDFIPSVVKISVSANIRQALKNELNTRGKTIFEALEIHERLISLLRQTIDSDIVSIAQSRELRNVIPPIIAPTPIGNPDAWIKLRQQTLTYSQTVSELTEAAQSLTEFKELFKAILEDKVTSARIESFLKETDDFIKIVEKNKAKPSENSESK